MCRYECLCVCMYGHSNDYRLAINSIHTYKHMHTYVCISECASVELGVCL